MRLNIYSSTRNRESYALIVIYIHKSIHEKSYAEKICTLFKSADITIVIILVTVHYYQKASQINTPSPTSDKRENIKRFTDPFVREILPLSQRKEMTLYDLYLDYNTKKKNQNVFDDKFVLFVAILVLVNKYFHDCPYSYTCWSKLANIDKHKLCNYEEHVLSIFDYNLYINNDILHASFDKFEIAMGKYDLIKTIKKQRGIMGIIFSCLGSKYK